jgi:hypothetical protein
LSSEVGDGHSTSEEQIWRLNEQGLQPMRRVRAVVRSTAATRSVATRPSDWTNNSTTPVPALTLGDSLSQSPPLEAISVDSEGYNGVGRSFAITSGYVPLWYNSGRYNHVIRNIVGLITRQFGTDAPRRYRDIWRQSRGPELLEIAKRESGGCATRSQNACFAYMLLATHIPLLGAPGSAEFNEGLEYIGLPSFLAHEGVVVLLQDLLRSSRRNGEVNGNRNEGTVYSETFAVNWIERCPAVTDTSLLRKIVLRHRLDRYSYITDPPSTRPLELEHIRRDHALIDSAPILSQDARSIRRGASSCQFMNEDANGDGVLREWFTTVTQEIYASDYGLFERRESPACTIISEYSIYQDLMYFNVVGRFMALALIQENPIGVDLPESFYARLMGQDVTLEMVEQFDEEFAQGIRALQSASSIQVEAIGVPVEGSGFVEDVTMENREEQIQAALNNIGINRQHEQFMRLQAGFNDVIPSELLVGIRPSDMQDFIYGDAIIEANELIDAFDIQGYTRTSQQIVWLSRVIEELSQMERRQFLRFVTSNTQLPLGGFAILGYIQIVRVPYSVGKYPTARTCFKRLNLPEYPDFELLRDGLLVAIRSNGVALSERIFHK